MKIMHVLVSNLHKNYRIKKSLFNKNSQDFLALRNVSFSLAPGQAVGLIGLNGAGKSTLIKILCGILSPTKGTVTIDGKTLSSDLYEYKKRIGVLFGHRGQLWNDIAVKDSYDLLQKIYAIPKPIYQERLEEYIHQFELEDLIGKPLRGLSLGQRMKCEIVGCLLHQPELLLLDEATLGLDLFTRELVLREIKSIQQKTKMTLVFTSHNLDDVENLCERILILDKGQILFDDSMLRLREEYTGQYTLTVYLKDLKPTSGSLLRNKNVELDPAGRYVRIALKENEALELGKWIQEIKIIAEVDRFELQTVSFESIIKELYLRGDE